MQAKLNLVTVVIPSYRHEQYLRGRIDSILAQQHRPVEILILDDASTDGSDAIIREYAGRYDAIRYIRNEENSGGPFPQWNKGVREAKGDLIWIAESDDWAERELLDRLVAVMRSDPQVVMSYCQSLQIDVESRPLQDMTWWTNDVDDDRFRQDFVMDGAEFARRYMTLKNVVPNASGVLFRKDAYLATGGADNSFRMCGDWVLWAKVMVQGRIGFVADPLNHFREHANTVRSSVGQSTDNVCESYRAVDEVFRVSGPTLEQRRCSAERLAWWWMKSPYVNRDEMGVREVVRIVRSAFPVDRRIGRRLLAKATAGFTWRMKTAALKFGLCKPAESRGTGR